MQQLSISIVNYKNNKEIAEEVESLEKILGNSITWSAFVVDNSCRIENPSQLKEVINICPHAFYVDPHDNLGFGGGHNLVIENTNSIFHLIMNPDIEINEQSIFPLINYLENHNDTGLVIPKIVDESGKLQDAYREQLTVIDMFIRMFCKSLFPKRMAKHSLQGKDYGKTFDIPFAQGCFVMARTSLLKKLKGFDEHYFMYLEDADLSRRMNLVSKVKYVPTASVIHHWEKGSHHDYKLFKYHLNSMVYYFKKWGVKWL